jgi:hypothetical protein
MMEWSGMGMLKCPVNINFVKVIVFIEETILATQSLSLVPWARAAFAPHSVTGRQGRNTNHSIWIFHGY